MKKIKLISITILLVSFAMTSCTSTSLARLPSNDKLFISTASENAFIASGNQLEFPYQPIGYIKITQKHLTPYMFLPSKSSYIRAKYSSLENTLMTKLSDKAVTQLGADGIINLKWNVIPGFVTYVEVTGLAVKRKDN